MRRRAYRNPLRRRKRAALVAGIVSFALPLWADFRVVVDSFRVCKSHAEDASAQLYCSLGATGWEGLQRIHETDRRAVGFVVSKWPSIEARPVSEGSSRKKQESIPLTGKWSGYPAANVDFPKKTHKNDRLPSIFPSSRDEGNWRVSSAYPKSDHLFFPCNDSARVGCRGGYWYRERQGLVSQRIAAT